MLAKIWPTHSKNTSPLLWTISFTLKIWPPLYGKDIHLWRQVPTTSARSKQLRQLHRRRLPICCSDPAVHHREEQGHQEVPWRTLRLREDYHCQGRGLGGPWPSPAKWFQVIKACRCLDGEINPFRIYPCISEYEREWVSFLLERSSWIFLVKDLWWSEMCPVIDGFSVTLTVHTW